MVKYIDRHTKRRNISHKFSCILMWIYSFIDIEEMKSKLIGHFPRLSLIIAICCTCDC